MKKRLTAGVILLVTATILTWSLLAQTTSAQPRRPGAPAPQSSLVIPEQKRPWPGLPWIVGAGMAVATLLVAFKSSKRTHLD